MDQAEAARLIACSWRDGWKRKDSSVKRLPTCLIRTEPTPAVVFFEELDLAMEDASKMGSVAGTIRRRSRRSRVTLPRRIHRIGRRSRK